VILRLITWWMKQSILIAMKKSLLIKVIPLLSCLFAPATLLARGTAVISTEDATVTLLSEQVKAVITSSSGCFSPSLPGTR